MASISYDFHLNCFHSEPYEMKIALLGQEEEDEEEEHWP
jgi:hypothetical protein